MSDTSRFTADDISQTAVKIKLIKDQLFAEVINAGELRTVVVDKYGRVVSGSNVPEVAIILKNSPVSGEFDKTDTMPMATTRMNYNGNFYATKVYGAVFNDYAEFRQSNYLLYPGSVAVEADYGKIKSSENRLSKCPMIVSDTFGFAIGEQDIPGERSIPIAVSGRVLAYTDKNINLFKVGDALCSGRSGTVSKMKWYEKIIYPDRIVGMVSEIPNYLKWGTNNVNVDNRIWVRVR